MAPKKNRKHAEKAMLRELVDDLVVPLESIGSRNQQPERTNDAPPSSLCEPKKVQRVGFVEMVKNLVSLLASSTKRGRGVVLEVPGLD
jgi:hypothetical protein